MFIIFETAEFCCVKGWCFSAMIWPVFQWSCWQWPLKAKKEREFTPVASSIMFIKKGSTSKLFSSSTLLMKLFRLFLTHCLCLFFNTVWIKRNNIHTLRNKKYLLFLCFRGKIFLSDWMLFRWRGHKESHIHFRYVKYLILMSLGHYSKVLFFSFFQKGFIPFGMWCAEYKHSKYAKM